MQGLGVEGINNAARCRRESCVGCCGKYICMPREPLSLSAMRVTDLNASAPWCGGAGGRDDAIVMMGGLKGLVEELTNFLDSHFLSLVPHLLSDSLTPHLTSPHLPHLIHISGVLARGYF